MKPIPESLLQAAEANARPPVKAVNKYTASIFSIVGDIKSARRLEMPLKPAWERLREVLDKAAMENDFTAFEDLQKSLANLDVASARITVITGDRETGERHHFAIGYQKNKHRRPITMALIQAIRNCQGRHNRAPTRSEILDEMNRILEGGTDETEVSSQLTQLGWNDLL